MQRFALLKCALRGQPNGGPVPDKVIQPLVCEILESRQFLSATVGVQPNVAYLPSDVVQPAAASSGVPGHSPEEIANAYGFDKISFNNGTIAADGTGQTIAIVDAYNDPNIAKDLSVFDQHFGLAAPRRSRW